MTLVPQYKSGIILHTRIELFFSIELKITQKRKLKTALLGIRTVEISKGSVLEGDTMDNDIPPMLGISQVKRDFSRIAKDVATTGKTVVVLKGSKPIVQIAPLPNSSIQDEAPKTA